MSRNRKTSQSLTERKPVLPRIAFPTNPDSRSPGSSIELMAGEPPSYEESFVPPCLDFKDSYTTRVEAAFRRCLGICPIFDSLTRALHCRDLSNLSLVSKAIRQGMVNADGFPSRSTCDGGIASSCWACRRQICNVRTRNRGIDSKCAKGQTRPFLVPLLTNCARQECQWLTPYVANPHTTSHVENCKLICKGCFYETACKKARNSYWLQPAVSHTDARFPKQDLELDVPFWTPQSSQSVPQPDPPALRRTVCQDCFGPPPQTVLQKVRYEKRLLARRALVTDKCQLCDKELGRPNAGGTRLRWWWCSDCSGECRHELHDGAEI